MLAGEPPVVPLILDKRLLLDSKHGILVSDILSSLHGSSGFSLKLAGFAESVASACFLFSQKKEQRR